MTKHEMPGKAERGQGDNAPRPVRSLRGWLDHLAARDRLCVIKPNADLKFEVAAYAKRLDGQRASFFPRPGGHAIPVVSGLVSDRGWMAEAMGVDPADVVTRFQEAALNPLPCQEVASAPAQEVVHRDIDLQKLLPLPTHNEHDGGPYISAGLMIVRNPKTGKQNVSIHRCQVTGQEPPRCADPAAPHQCVLRDGGGELGQPLDVPRSLSASIR